MKFVLFVEGHTEKLVLPPFLKRWLDPRLSQPVGIQPVRFEGWAEQWEDCANRARRHLNDPRHGADIVGVVSLLDLYGPTVYPPNVVSAADRYVWGKQAIERQVADPRFRQFFAVHETEAWLFSQPDVFPPDIRKALPGKPPETINFAEPPAKLLDRIYMQKTQRHYQKVVQGQSLFARLDPEVAHCHCPRLASLLEDMLAMAQAAGL